MQSTINNPRGEPAPAVRSLTAAEQERAFAVVVTAFSSDPVARWVYPDASQYLKFFPPFVEAFAGGAINAGSAFVTNDVLATALWLPPDVHADGDRLEQLLEEAVPDERKDEIYGFVGAQAALHPEFPHWYLPLLAVDPTLQGRGAGSALLRHALEICDGLGMPAYLEATTERSRDLYARHGFEQTSLIQFGSSPTMWGMLRQPR